MSLDVMKQALAALEGWANHGEWVWPESALEQAKRNTTESITALRAAIEQAQEPVAWISEGGDVSRSKRYMEEMGFKCNPLYTAPRQWQGLTADEIWDVWCEQAKREFVTAFARSLEAKLKDKNL